MARYGEMKDACQYYECSTANITQRVRRGTLPFRESGGKRQYLLSEKYKVRNREKEVKPKRVIDLTKKKEKQEKKAFKEIAKINEQELQDISKIETTETLPTIQKNGYVENDEEVDEPTYKVAQPRESLFTNPELVEKALSTRMTITDSDRECIEMFCEHYRDYLLYYRLATAEPIVKGFVNPYFKLSRDQWLIVKELSAQLGIGIKNRLKLKVEEPKSVNPFEELMK